MSQLAPYEVYAVRYAFHKRGAAENFLGGDPHNVPMPLDYFVWAIVGVERTYIVDTGFDQKVAEKRGRTFVLCPSEGLKMLGVDIDRVNDVIITHMHFDHCGNHHLFPTARFHVQDAEMAYVTGRCMCHKPLAHTFEVDDVCAMVRRLFDGRLQFHDKTDDLAPGISVHHIVLLRQEIASSDVTVRVTLREHFLGETGHERGPAGTVYGLPQGTGRGDRACGSGGAVA